MEILAFVAVLAVGVAYVVPLVSKYLGGLLPSSLAGNSLAQAFIVGGALALTVWIAAKALGRKEIGLDKI